MSQTFKRNRFTWLLYLLLAFYAYFLNILGPITPFLKGKLSLSYTISSLHFTGFALGIIIVGLGGHLLIRRTGRWRALWIGAAGMSLSVVLLVLGRSPAITIGASFLMGLVGSLILAVVPSALSDEHGEMQAVAISEANVVSSLVSAAAPLLVGWFALTTGGGWRLALVVVAFAPLALYFGLGKGQYSGEASAAKTSDGVRQSLPSRYWIYWVAILLAVSVEFCMVYWSADYMQTSFGLPKAEAAQTVTLFLAGMISGRLAGSRLVQRFTPYVVATASILIAAAGFLVFWTAGSPLWGGVGLFFTGLGVASLYPLLLSLAIDASGGNNVQAGARASLASGTAIFALPLVLGRLADAVGIRAAYSVVIFLMAGVFLIILLTSRLSSLRQVEAGKN